jgi:hypothetical protein
MREGYPELHLLHSGAIEPDRLEKLEVIGIKRRMKMTHLDELPMRADHGVHPREVQHV